MPARVLLEAAELAYLCTLGTIEVANHAPIAGVASVPPCAEGSAGALRLRERGLVIDDGAVGTSRLNAAFRGVLEAAARPEEVLTLRVTGAGQPGFALCRRGAFWTECSIGSDGETKLEFPLSRSAMVLAAASALSSGHDEAAPAGFAFQGTAAELLVLHTLVAAGGAGVTRRELASRVRTHVDGHAGSALVTALADPAGLHAIFTRDEASAEAAARLQLMGLVREDGERVTASRPALAVLRTAATAGFSATRTVVRAGSASTISVQVWRMGERNVVVRALRLPDGSVGLDARDMQRADVRALVAAVYQEERALA